MSAGGRTARGRATGILPVPFRNPRSPDLPLEVLHFSELRAKASPAYLARPQRPDFFVLMLVTSGSCTHEVDFCRVELSPGRLLRSSPGQVLRFDLHADVEGWLVLFTADFISPEGRLEEAATEGAVAELGPAEADVAWLVERISRFSREDAPDPVARRRLLHHLLEALLLVLGGLRRAPTGVAASPAGLATAFQIFRAEVERRFAATRRLEDYATSTGYSAKMLSRASLAMTGLGAKTFIDRRVVLEARRLLAHTELTAAQIGHRLGFSEATNFIKFFQRSSEESPTAFRARSRASGKGRR